MKNMDEGYFTFGISDRVNRVHQKGLDFIWYDGGEDSLEEALWDFLCSGVPQATLFGFSRSGEPAGLLAVMEGGDVGVYDLLLDAMRLVDGIEQLKKLLPLTQTRGEWRIPLEGFRAWAIRFDHDQ